MADLATLVINANLNATYNAVFPQSGARIRNYVCLVAINAGQGVYRDPTTGKAGLADAGVAGATQQFRGVALTTGGIGDTIKVLEEGEVYGYDLSGSNYDDLIYLDAAGQLATTANGTKTVQVGRVTCLTDLAVRTKVLFVRARMEANW
jgi:hypothetical protein